MSPSTLYAQALAAALGGVSDSDFKSGLHTGAAGAVHWTAHPDGTVFLAVLGPSNYVYNLWVERRVCRETLVESAEAVAALAAARVDLLAAVASLRGHPGFELAERAVQRLYGTPPARESLPN